MLSVNYSVGTLGVRRAELEEVELEIMMRVDAINERITSLKAEEAEHAAVIADLEIRKENALTILHKDLDAIAKDRTETVNGVAKELVDLYEKIRETTGGAGAAALSAGSCTGCNLSVNAVELKRMSDLADDEVVRCEECRCWCEASKWPDIFCSLPMGDLEVIQVLPDTAQLLQKMEKLLPSYMTLLALLQIT